MRREEKGVVLSARTSQSPEVTTVSELSAIFVISVSLTPQSTWQDFLQQDISIISNNHSTN